MIELAQRTTCGIGESLTESGEVSRLGTGEGVDGLCRIAHHTELGPIATPQIQQRLLQGADVLIFINHQMAVRPADRFRDLTVLLHQRCRAQQDVFEVDAAAVPLGLFVRGEDSRNRFGVVGGELAIVLRRQPRIVLGADVAHLGPRDL
jgi:hypothetical protein